MNAFEVSTRKRVEMADITGKVKELVRGSSVQEGVCVVYVPHTTGGVTINESADPDVMKDFTNTMNELIPFDADYSHAEGNSAAHIKASLTGSSVQVIVSGGELVLGTWQGIFFTEYDGPRNRKVYVKVINA